jgi:AcrR family transcriptional regulator
MTQLSISAAARASGRNKATLYRHIKQGILSATHDDVAGHITIDTSELLRVYGELASSNKCDVALQHNVTPNNAVQQLSDTRDAALRQNAALNDAARQLSDAREEIDRLRRELDRERSRCDKAETERDKEREHSRQLELSMRALPEHSSAHPGLIERVARYLKGTS